MNETLFKSLLAGEDILVLRRSPEGRFTVAGEPPAWAGLIAPGQIQAGAGVDPAAIFAFLDHFLQDAQAAWVSETAPPVTSSVWTETLPDGEQLSFTATARRLGNAELLLIRSLGVDFEERRKVLQRAREMALAHERLRKEISKKEALLHCLVHDVVGPLTSMTNCFHLLELEKNLSADGRELVSLGKSEALRQHSLLRGVLDLFAVELGVLENFSTDPATAPDLLACVRSVLKQLSPSMTLKDVTHRLIRAPEEVDSWRVVGHAERLGRVLYNLLENALRHTAVHSTITVRLLDEGEFIRACVEDEGAGLEPAEAGQLFERFRQGERGKGKAGLGLFFCRMTIERWGGQIGCQPAEQGGAQFWFQLPKPKAPEP